MDYIINNYKEIIESIGYIYIGLTILASITPSNKDNTFLEKVGKLLDRLGCKLKK